MPHPTPRLFILRHGETEWSLDGRHTGTSDIPLTANGEKRVIATGKALVGDDRLIVRKNLCGIYVSPRTRAQRTLQLLMGGQDAVEIIASARADNPDATTVRSDGRMTAFVTEDVAEWNYGSYEGRTSKDIAADRKANGEGVWDIWRDGCPDGDQQLYMKQNDLGRTDLDRSPQQIMQRLDRFIESIRSKHHASAFEHIEKDKVPPPCDVLVVAHGHILRALAARWIGRNIRDNPSLILEAGGVGCLSYEHHSIDEPAILLGGAFVVNVAESAEQAGEVKASH